MKLYEVESGEIHGKFRALDPETSFLKAIRRVQNVRGRPVPVPGLLLRIRELNEDFTPLSDWIYYNPLDLIKRL